MKCLSRFTKMLLCLSVGVCLMSAGAWQSAASESIPSRPLTDSAADGAGLKYLPETYWLASSIDVKTIMQAAVNSEQAKANPQYVQFKQALSMAKMFTGIDLEEDVDRVTLFAAGDPDQEFAWLAAIEGSFRNSVVEARLSRTLGRDVVTETHKDRTIYRTKEMTYCFPESSVILVGDEKLVRQAIDRLDAGAATVPPALKNVLNRIPAESIVWVAVRPQALLGVNDLKDWRTENRQLCENLEAIECLSVTFDLDENGLLIKALGYASEDGKAGEIHKYLSDYKRDLLHKKGINVVFATLLVLSDLKTNGQYVQGSLRLTEGALTELWETKFVVKPNYAEGIVEERRTAANEQ